MRRSMRLMVGRHDMTSTNVRATIPARVVTQDVEVQVVTPEEIRTNRNKTMGRNEVA